MLWLLRDCMVHKYIHTYVKYPFYDSFLLPLYGACVNVLEKGTLEVRMLRRWMRFREKGEGGGGFCCRSARRSGSASLAEARNTGQPLWDVGAFYGGFHVRTYEGSCSRPGDPQPSENRKEVRK